MDDKKAKLRMARLQRALRYQAQLLEYSADMVDKDPQTSLTRIQSAVGNLVNLAGELGGLAELRKGDS